MTTVDYIVEPSQERHDAYTFYYEKYKEFYPLAKDWMHAVTTRGDYHSKCRGVHMAHICFNFGM